VLPARVCSIGRLVAPRDGRAAELPPAIRLPIPDREAFHQVGHTHAPAPFVVVALSRSELRIDVVQELVGCWDDLKLTEVQRKPPVMGQKPVDMLELYTEVANRGGFRQVATRLLLL
jgi:hypothetical protein